MCAVHSWFHAIAFFSSALQVAVLGLNWKAYIRWEYQVCAGGSAATCLVCLITFIVFCAYRSCRSGATIVPVFLVCMCSLVSMGGGVMLVLSDFPKMNMITISATASMGLGVVICVMQFIGICALSWRDRRRQRERERHEMEKNNEDDRLLEKNGQMTELSTTRKTPATATASKKAKESGKQIPKNKMKKTAVDKKKGVPKTEISADGPLPVHGEEEAMEPGYEECGPEKSVLDVKTKKGKKPNKIRRMDRFFDKLASVYEDEKTVFDHGMATNTIGDDKTSRSEVEDPKLRTVEKKKDEKKEEKKERKELSKEKKTTRIKKTAMADTAEKEDHEELPPAIAKPSVMKVRVQPSRTEKEQRTQRMDKSISEKSQKKTQDEMEKTQEAPAT